MAFVLSEPFKRHSFPYNSVFVSNFHYTAYYSASQIETYPATEREKCNIKCERKRKPPDALFFYPETEKKAIHGHFIKSVLCGVG